MYYRLVASNIFLDILVYKSNGTLVENLDELKGETEVIAISKQSLEYNYAAKSHEIHIILRWYKGYF